jgi:hypothetical protein
MEEIADMARSQKRAIRSDLVVLHLDQALDPDFLPD